MLLKNLKFLAKARLRLVSRVLPVKKTEVLFFDHIEISFNKPVTNHIVISSITLPQITTDLCPNEPDVITFDVLDDQQEIEELTPWLGETLPQPEIVGFPLELKLPRVIGKSYRKPLETDTTQPKLFDLDTDKNCIHGIRKEWCSSCVQGERKRAEAERATLTDLFDVIFPLLQPPLGESFDSPIAFPPNKELYPFQRTGVKFLVERERALLGDEMGLGKSIQAIVAIRFLFRIGKATSGLVLCPKSVLTDWEKKFWEWAPEIRVVKVRGTTEHRPILWNTQAHIYLTTYETLRQDLLEYDVARTHFDLIILDEIQYLKNPGAEKTKAVRKVEGRIRWGLSGTPMENRVEELISVFSYLKPGLVHYEDAGRPGKLKNAIKPYFLRRRKVDALSLPEKFREEAWLELAPAQQQAYERAEQEGIVALNEEGKSITIHHVLALITKLKQICNRDPVSGESCKLEHLRDKLQKVADQGDKALVFSQYPDKTLRFLIEQLQEFGPSVYHGALSDSQRENIIEKFQREETNKVLLMSVKAGGLGLTLTRANYVYHFDLWWNPATALQAEDRTHRIGQRKTVFVTSLLTVDTIEERIQNLLRRKRELFNAVIDDLSDTNLTQVLTEEELFGLFNLKRPERRIGKDRLRETTATEVLSRSSPNQFERLVGGLFEKMGYQVKVTQTAKDGGVDIYARRSSVSGTDLLAIQCKHYPAGVVGVEHARALYGVIQDDPSVTKGVLVTSGEFSQDCREFARGKRIELFNGMYLRGLVERFLI